MTPPALHRRRRRHAADDAARHPPTTAAGGVGAFTGAGVDGAGLAARAGFGTAGTGAGRAAGAALRGGRGLCGLRVLGRILVARAGPRVRREDGEPEIAAAASAMREGTASCGTGQVIKISFRRASRSSTGPRPDATAGTEAPAMNVTLLSRPFA
jgi:hypothetical protein